MTEKKPSHSQASRVSLTSRFPRRLSTVTITLSLNDVRLIVACLRRAQDADPPVLSIYHAVQTKLLLESLLEDLPIADQGAPPNS